MKTLMSNFPVWITHSVLWMLAMLIAGFLLARIWRRARKHGGWNAAMMKAAGLPMMIMIICLGTLQATLAPVEYFFDNWPEHLASWRTAILIIGSFWMLLRLASAAERLYEQKTNIGGMPVEPSVLLAGFRVARYIIIIIAVLTTMDSLGISISGLLAFGGIGGAVVAFAAKDTLSNFFSGIMIFTERPFVVGDWIRCPDVNVEGVVENIGWRITRLRTFDQRPLYVPNSMFSVNVIENPQRMKNRRIYEYCGLRYEDIGKMPVVLADIRTMLREHDRIDQNQIQMVGFDNYGESSLNFFIYTMTITTDWTHFHEIKENVLLKIAAIVEKHGAEFAFPTRTLHVASSDSIVAAQAISATASAAKK